MTVGLGSGHFNPFDSSLPFGHSRTRGRDYLTLKPSPESLPMSFVNPDDEDHGATSMKPMMLERSIVCSETGFRRTASTTAQKMRPPSSGRNGNRLTIASDSEIRGLGSSTASRGFVEDRLTRRLVGADDAGELSALLRVESASRGA